MEPYSGSTPKAVSLEVNLPGRLVVAEPLPLLREAFSALCEQRGFAVVGQCGDGRTALTEILAQKPDVGILDLDLPEMHTLEVVRRLRQRASATRIVVVSSRSDRKTVVEALRSGAQAFVPKTSPVGCLFDAIANIGEGSFYLPPTIKSNEIFRAQPADVDQDLLETLSAREHQVFTMYVEGVRAKEIAARLSVSPKTIDTYRASLMRKLGINNVAGLVRFSLRREMTSNLSLAASA